MSMDNNVEYDCPADKFPHEYPEWNNKWYSPLCRSWYNDQKSKPKQNTLGDLYVFANGSVFGLTPCAPVVKYNKAGTEVDF